MNNDIRQFRISPIEEVIGKTVADEAEFIVLENVLAIKTVHLNDTEYGIELVPFCITNPEAHVKLQKSLIPCEFLNIPDGLVKLYLQRTSGIQIVSALDELERAK